MGTTNMILIVISVAEDREDRFDRNSEEIDADEFPLVRHLNDWLAPHFEGSRILQNTTAGSGGSRQPENMTFTAFVRSQCDFGEFARLALSLPWQVPEEVIVLIGLDGYPPVVLRPKLSQADDEWVGEAFTRLFDLEERQGPGAVMAEAVSQRRFLGL